MDLPAGEVPAPTASAKPAPGPAYFGVDQVGIVRLGVDGTMRKIVSHPYRIHDLVLGPDGRTVWAGGYGGVWRIVGDQAEKLSDMSAYEVAPTPDGGVVVLGLKIHEEGITVWPAIFRLEGRRWVEVTGYQPKRRDGLEATILHDVAVDHDNRIHLGSSGGWWREEEPEWHRFGTRQPSLETLFFTEITLGNDGVLFGTCNGGLFYVKPDDTMFRVPVDPTGEGFHDVTIAPTGEVAMVGDRDQIVRVRPGESARRKRLAELGAPGVRVRDLAIDGQSRTWVATDDHVTVLGPDDAVLQRWARGTVPEIRGEVRSLVVLGSGPKLPKQHAPIVGTVVGRLAVSHVRTVLLCRHTPYRTLSCDTGSEVARSEVGTDGRFRFEGVPQGSYRFAGFDAGPVPCCTQLDGGALDLGTLGASTDP
jgi:hypothetical protein